VYAFPMLRLLAITVVACGLFFGGCGASSKPMFKVNPINSYRAYGEYHAATDDAAIVARAEKADPTGIDIRLFQESIPPGIQMTNQTLGVVAGYKHKLIGKYAYSGGTEEPKDALVSRVRKMCVATGANAAMIVFMLEDSEKQERAQGIEAVLIHMDPLRDEEVVPQ